MANSTLKIPARRDYKPKNEQKYTHLGELPFVRYPGYHNKEDIFCLWQVPVTDDYGIACEMGREYAGHLAQYLMDNPYCVDDNLLGHIAEHIDFKDKSAAKGYWVGFFSQLGRWLYVSALRVDIFKDIDMVNAQCAEINARREAEEAAEEGTNHEY